MFILRKYLQISPLFYFFIFIFIVLFRWRWGEWFSNWASQINGSNHRRSDATVPDFSHMVFGDCFLCCSCIPKPVLQLPPKCALRIISLGSNCGASNWDSYGCKTTKKIDSDTCNELVIFAESRALQLERARSNHNIRKFRFKWCLCCGHHYHCQGFLSPGNPYSCSLFVNTNYSGCYWIRESLVPKLIRIVSLYVVVLELNIMCFLCNSIYNMRKVVN